MERTKIYSKIIAGTMTWGNWGKQLSQSEISDLMHHCISNNISTFDHADIYGNYENETLFGRAFVESGIERNNIQLITKCGLQMTRGRNNKVKHYEYSKEYIIWSAEESLKKLQTDYLDLFLLHRPSPLMEPDIIAEAIQKLTDDGKIKQFGVSNFTPSQIALLETAISVTANQVEFSLNQNECMYDGTFDDCIANSRMAMAWSPLGTFFKEKNEDNTRISKALAELGEKYDADESQLLLAFILKHPVGIHPVVGTTNKERLTASVKATEIDLELEDWFVLLEASKGHRVP